MISLSHNSKDRPIVELIAVQLRNVFGEGNVFYDSWSIQPGDSVIGKMNDGLSNAEFVFLFLSKNSLSSKMVGLKWMNALLKSEKSKCKLIPVRLDDSDMPTILSDINCLDLFTNGLEVTVRQMKDVVKGQSTFRQIGLTKPNLVPVLRHQGSEIHVLIKPNYYMEPTAIFMSMTPNSQDEIKWALTSDNVFHSGFNKDLKLPNGDQLNGIYISVSRALTPNYPLTLKFQKRTDKPIQIKYVLKGKNPKEFDFLPFFDECVS